METLSIKVSRADKERLKRLASERKVSLSALLREGLAQLVGGGTAVGKVTCYEKAAKYLESGDAVGASGRGDLSANKAYLEDFGR